MTAIANEPEPTSGDWIASSEAARHAQNVLTFSNFQLDVLNQQLLREGRVIKLRPRTFDLLRYLVEHSQRLVTKRELLDSVWSGVVVSEAVIKVQVSELRRALGDTSTPPCFVETLHRRGYRFLCRVEGAALVSKPLADESTQALRVAPGAGIVGRDAELLELNELLENVQRGRSRVVFVTGEAGIGKTAIVNTFLAGHCPDTEVWVASGQCIEQYGSGSAYLPILEALRQLCTGGNSPVVLEVFRRHAPDWLVHMPEAFATAPSAAAVACCIPATPERLVRQMAEAVGALSALRPVVLTIEDLQWVDPSTLNLLSYLAQRLATGRLMLIGTYRSSDVRFTEHPVWALHQVMRSRDGCGELAICKLSLTDVARYLSSQFSGHRFPGELAPKIFQITAGNPLFMVRVVDGLTRSGALREQAGYWTLAADVESIDARVPDSVLSMITWELERLGQSDREVLEAASIAGLEFSASEVARALARDPVQVESLCSHWIRQGRFLEQVLGHAGEPCFELRCRFGHALYQQVIYEQLAPSRRAQLHRLFAVLLEARHLALPEPIAASLAMHFGRAGDQVHAIRHSCMAGEYALKHGAYAEASFHLRNALELLERTPEYADRDRQELTILLTLRVPLVATLGYAAAEVEQLYARATRKCLEIGSAASSCAVQAGVSVFHLVRGRTREAMSAARQCLALAGENDELRLDAELAMGVSSFYAGEFVAAAAHVEVALSHHAGVPQHWESVYHHDADLLGQFYSSYLLWYGGHPARAQAQAHQVLQQARERRNPFTVAAAVQSLGALQLYCREAGLLAQCADELTALCSDQGFAFYRGVAAAHRGLAVLYQGDLEAGISIVREAWSALKAAGSEIGGTVFCAELAEAYGTAGDLQAGFQVLKEGFDMLHARGEGYWEPELHRVHGELCARASDASHRTSRSACGLSSQPEVSFRRALIRAQQMGARPLELRAATSLARFLGAKCDEGTLQLLRTAMSSLSEGRETPDYRRALACLEDIERG